MTCWWNLEIPWYDRPSYAKNIAGWSIPAIDLQPRMLMNSCRINQLLVGWWYGASYFQLELFLLGFPLLINRTLVDPQTIKRTSNNYRIAPTDGICTDFDPLVPHCQNFRLTDPSHSSADYPCPLSTIRYAMDGGSKWGGPKSDAIENVTKCCTLW